MVDVKAPVANAAPSFVELSPVVGAPTVFQHTPCAVGFGAPRSVISPLPVAVVVVMFVTVSVVTVGTCGKVVNNLWLPYTVPAVLVA